MSATGPALAVDLGGTKTAVAVVDPQGGVSGRQKAPAAASAGLEASLAQLSALAGAALKAASLDWGQIAAVGVCVPGIYFADTGEAWAPNLWGFESVPLRRALEQLLPVPVVIDSDRAAYVLGEAWLGVARGLTDVVFLAVGTGIGAGILAGGRLVRGAQGIAGAVGWFALDPRAGALYQRMGCFEAEAAGPAVARRAAAAGLGDLPAEAVAARARRGDPAARAVMDEIAAWLGMGVANIVSMLNPHMVVLGGGLMQAGDLLLEGVRRHMREWAQPVAAQQVRIELSSLGEDAGLLGAARLTWWRGE